MVKIIEYMVSVFMADLPNLNALFNSQHIDTINCNLSIQ